MGAVAYEHGVRREEEAKYLMRTKSCIMNLWRAFVGWVI